jgi:hypothetical protein
MKEVAVRREKVFKWNKSEQGETPHSPTPEDYPRLLRNRLGVEPDTDVPYVTRRNRPRYPLGKSTPS